MDSIKKLLKSLPLILLVIASATLAEEPLPPISEWVPDSVSVVIPSDRKNPFAFLEWKKSPVFSSNKEKTVLGIEAEFVFPELKRVGGERYYPTNKLLFASTPNLPRTCYYQDNYFLDRCENWTLGIDTSEQCLLSVLPNRITVNYRADPIPPSVTTARYQIQTVGIDTVSGKGFTPIGRFVGPTEESRLVGEFCSAFCETCFSPTTGWIEKSLCLPLAKLKNPYATVDWLEAFCPSCEAAKNQSPEWRNFRIDQAQCIEPVHTPGTTTSYSCVRSPYADGCDPIDLSTPQRICAPGEKRCNGANREICNDDGLSWGNGFTCGCGCNGNDCGDVNICSAGTKTCLDSSRLSICNQDTCGSSIKICPCGCTNNDCRLPVCTTSYCRDADTQILCSTSGCSTTAVRCGYGCSNGQCQGSGGSPPDMTSAPLPDMSVPLPPPDLTYVPPGTEVCDGRDNNGNGQVDELPGCWLTVYRFRDPTTNARCYGPTNIAPPVCTGYVFEKALFTVPSSPWLDGTTNERVQCSSGTNHIITIKNGGEHAALQASGWSCAVSLGYWFQTGLGKTAGTPYAYTCPVYRTWYTTPGGMSRVFSSQTESFFGTFTCEVPTRGDVVQNVPCGKPTGC